MTTPALLKWQAVLTYSVTVLEGQLEGTNGAEEHGVPFHLVLGTTHRDDVRIELRLGVLGDIDV